ncbi:hypothetical protein ID866_13355 [Astraeus odoratus]|nr:hypothetical protein ID866_13355 [Astraeus odoratus]
MPISNLLSAETIQPVPSLPYQRLAMPVDPHTWHLTCIDWTRHQSSTYPGESFELHTGCHQSFLDRENKGNL